MSEAQESYENVEANDNRFSNNDEMNHDRLILEVVPMGKKQKRKLLIYLLVSAVSFSYLVLPDKAGISVPIFIVIQFICLYFVAPKNKPLFMFIPIFILAFNSFISANGIWYVSNFAVTIVLYSVMALWMVDGFHIKDTSVWFAIKALTNTFEPIRYFPTPVKWCAEANIEHSETAKRIMTGIAISIPCLIFLLFMLSSADQIFSNRVAELFNNIQTLISVNIFIKIVFGIATGFYLFGLIYSVYQPKEEKSFNIKPKNGDMIVLNILLISILVIYTIFVAIQFQYLFADGNNLPYGLTYTYYARRGFFELLFLTMFNILLILVIVWLIKLQKGKWVTLTKTLCCYLCVVTVILLISSFYRMWLYNADDGLTRLRFLVFGFLMFEAIGLAFTFFYIIKPKFNIVAVYLVIALTYYLVLNIVPMDRIIAKDQIDRYFISGGGGINYTLTLSADAATEIGRLLESSEIHIREAALYYFKSNSQYYNDYAPRWQRWNLSVSGLNKIEELWSE